MHPEVIAHDNVVEFPPNEGTCQRCVEIVVETIETSQSHLPREICWILKVLGVFSAMLISYPHFYPQFAIVGTMFTGQRGSVPTRDCDELVKAGERQKRRIKLRFQALGAAECDSHMQNHTRRL
jgi:hypothetical protein